MQPLNESVITSVNGHPCVHDSSLRASLFRQVLRDRLGDFNVQRLVAACILRDLVPGINITIKRSL